MRQNYLELFGLSCFLILAFFMPLMTFAETTGSISGTVVAEDTGLPIIDTYVSAINSDMGGGESATTDSNGNYTITGLDAGNYTVQAGSSGPYVGEYFENIYNPNNASLVPISLNTDTIVNFQLAKEGTISGTIVAEDTGTPLAGIQVRVEAGYNQSGSATTDVVGNYTITGLSPGGYTVRAEGNIEYSREYYNNKYSSEDAETVTVTGGSNIRYD